MLSNKRVAAVRGLTDRDVGTRRTRGAHTYSRHESKPTRATSTVCQNRPLNWQRLAETRSRSRLGQGLKGDKSMLRKWTTRNKEIPIHRGQYRLPKPGKFYRRIAPIAAVIPALPASCSRCSMVFRGLPNQCAASFDLLFTPMCMMASFTSTSFPLIPSPDCALGDGIESCRPSGTVVEHGQQECSLLYPAHA